MSTAASSASTSPAPGISACGTRTRSSASPTRIFFSMREARQKLVDERRLLAPGGPIPCLVEKIENARGAKWVSSTKVPVYGENGDINGLVGISRDVTAYKHEEQKRQLMELQLRQSQKLESIGQLAAGIAHEINTPTQYVGDNTRFVKDSFAAIIKLLK